MPSAGINRIRPTVQVISDLSGADREFAFEFFGSIYFVAGFVVESEISFSDIQDGDVCFCPFREMPQFFRLMTCAGVQLEALITSANGMPICMNFDITLS